MQLQIHGDRLISDVQRDFSESYPYLRIEFFRNGTEWKNRYPAHKRIAQHFKLKESWIWKKDSGELSLSDSTTVLQLEKAFMDEFGLSVQVFRKSGNVWLETTMTDNWTLKQQSDHGVEISRLHTSRKFYPDDNDYEMNRDADH